MRDEVNEGVAAEGASAPASAPLKSLVYSSTAVQPFDDAQLDALLQQARTRNSSLGITGMLSYRGGSFIQFLEGSEDHIDALMASIRADQRHRDVRVLIEDRISERQFSSWTMGYERMRNTEQRPPAGFRDTFADLQRGDDDLITARAARELMFWFKVRSGAQE